MADTSGEQDIRGIDINRVAQGFADEEYILKKYCRQANTKNRELRWWKKTAGTLDSTDTSGITSSQIFNSGDQLSIKPIVEQSWTRQTSYIKEFSAESPTIAEADIKDSDIDLLGTNIQDIVRAVAQQVNIRIFSVLVEASASTPTTPNPTTVNTQAANGTGWDDTTSGDPIADILYGETQIYTYNYDASKCVIVMHPEDREHLMSWLITTKGSSIPEFSSSTVSSGKIMQLLGHPVHATTNVTKDNVYMFVPNKALTWKQFTPLRAVSIKEPLIGTKIRVKEEGEALLEHPRAVHIITDTIT